MIFKPTNLLEAAVLVGKTVRMEWHVPGMSEPYGFVDTIVGVVERDVYDGTSTQLGYEVRTSIGYGYGHHYGTEVTITEVWASDEDCAELGKLVRHMAMGQALPVPDRRI